MKKDENSKIPPQSENNGELIEPEGSSEPERPVSTEDNFEKCKKERDEYLDGWKRAKADFVNYKKEEAERMEQFLKFGQEAYIREFLPVLDSFDLALEAGRKHGDDVKGLLMIFAQLEDIMRKFGLERIRAEVGDKFDPNHHEAVTEIESKEEAGAIACGVASGYLLYGKVIRPARVKLSKGQLTTNN